MPFSHDMVHALAVVVDLINTSPEADGRDSLATLEELEAFILRHQVSGVEYLNPADLAEVRAVRSAFHAVFHAPDQPTAVSQLNALLGRTRITPNLTEHDGFSLHIHYHAPGASVAEHLAADCGVSLAHVLVEDEWERLRVCAAPDCSHVFVDESRNRSRVYCDSRTCGNRIHVAAYRARRRA
ncbi:CGNR zinc finger domain-containing protein [Streptosporangiaceae bacterium NEAU-GS5]|nr:CGNR zinc finger domain-containing protein [Streptosporangiaceae bacterium NEAU-GS5]